MINNTQDTAELLWTTIAQSCPELRQHIRIYPQLFRGQRWFILRDDMTGQYLRLNTIGYELLGRMDGKRSISTIIEFVNTHTDSQLTHTHVIELIGQLENIGALKGLPDKTSAQLISSRQTRRGKLRLSRLSNPLMIRIPLYDPNHLLEGWVRRTDMLFTWQFVTIWVGLVLAACFATLVNWQPIYVELSGNAFNPANLVLLWFLYPAMKFVHELAHAICVKRWGGEVHETGLTLLVLTPIPYVDASTAACFGSKYKRMLVSAAGIVTELFCAAVGLLVWLLIEDGILRDCAFSIFMLGTISTLLFNANPFLRFDGYFILQDLVEIPNLYNRSSQYLRFLIKKHILRFKPLDAPITTSGEVKWLIGYGALALTFRIFILIVLIIFLINKYLLLGVMLGVWTVIQQVLLPFYRFSQFLLTAPELKMKRQYSRALIGIPCLFALIFITMVPLPLTTPAVGVVSTANERKIVSETAGFIKSVSVQQGQSINSNEVIATLTNIELKRDIESLAAELSRLQIRRANLLETDIAAFALADRDLNSAQSKLSELEKKAEDLVLTSKTTGTFVSSDDGPLIGRYYEQGSIIGEVFSDGELLIKVAVPESSSGNIRLGIDHATIRMAQSLNRQYKARLVSETPSANHTLPSAALGLLGGGGIPIAFDDNSGLTSVEKVFHLQLVVSDPISVFGLGQRVFVSLHHEPEPLVHRWARSVRGLLLKSFPA